MTDSPVAPAPEPPGDFTTSSFWTSPSTYLTLITYALPLLNVTFGRDVSEQAQAVANLAPIVATGILLLMRSRAKTTVVNANLELAKLRASYSPQDGHFEARLDKLEQIVIERVIPLLHSVEQDMASAKRVAQVQDGDEPTIVQQLPADPTADSSDTIVFNGEVHPIPRTTSGKIDGRTAIGSFAKRSGRT